MSRGTAWFTHACVASVAVTGAVYAWMAWVTEPADELSVVNHPWQPALREAHVLAAPWLVFAVGVLWRVHIWGHIRAGFRARRRTGLVLAVLFAPMALSGYLLQVSVSPTWLSFWVWTHGVTGFAWATAFVIHLATSVVGATARVQKATFRARVAGFSEEPLEQPADAVQTPAQSLSGGDRAPVGTPADTLGVVAPKETPVVGS